MAKRIKKLWLLKTELMLGIQLKLGSLGCGLTIITDEGHLLLETL